jgi:hypothetical protein
LGIFIRVRPESFSSGVYPLNFIEFQLKRRSIDIVAPKNKKKQLKNEMKDKEKKIIHTHEMNAMVNDSSIPTQCQTK